MSKIITTNNGQQYRTQNFWPTAAGVGVGGATYFSVKNFLGPKLNKPFFKLMNESGQKIDSVIANKALDEVLKTPTIATKNIEIIDLGKLPKMEPPLLINYILGKKSTIVHDVNTYSKDIIEKEKHFNSICNCLVPRWKKPFKMIREHTRDTYRYIMQNGMNALCDIINKKVYVNRNNFCAASFHEIGHIMDPKLNIASAMVLKYATPILIGTALLKRKKVEGEESKGTFDKITTFIKNNATSLFLITSLPFVGIEFLASHRGAKLVKPHVNKETFGLIKKLQRYGGISHTSGVVTGCAALFAASKVKDILTKPHKVKNIEEA